MLRAYVTVLCAVGFNGASAVEGYPQSSKTLDRAHTTILSHHSDSLAQSSQNYPSISSLEPLNSQYGSPRIPDSNHGVPLSAKSLSKSYASVAITKHFGTPVDVKPEFGEKLTNTYIQKDGTRSSTRKASNQYKAYPNARALKTHYEAHKHDYLDEAINKYQDVNNLNIASKRPQHSYEVPNEETDTYTSPDFEESSDSKTIHKISESESRSIKEHVAPKSDGTYSVPKLNGPPSSDYGEQEQSIISKSINTNSGTRDGFTYDNNVKKGKSIAHGNLKAINNKYDAPKSSYMPKPTYGISKPLNTKYGLPKSFDGVPRSLANNYDAMNSLDQKYGIPRSIDKMYAVPNEFENNEDPIKSANNQYGFARSENIKNIESREKINVNHENQSKMRNNPVKEHIKAKLYDSFASYNSDYEDINNFGDYITDNVSPKYIAQVYDQQFEDSRSFNYGVPSYGSYDFDPIKSGNGYNNFKTSSQDIEEYPDPDTQYAQKELPIEYDVPTRLSSPDFSGSSARISPGITGVTQAIVRTDQSSIGSKYKRIHQTEQTPRVFDQGPYNGYKEIQHSLQNPLSRTNYEHSNGGYDHQEHEITIVGKDNSNGRKDFSGYAKGRKSDEDKNEPPMYNFEYVVSDYGTESDFGHRESREYARTKGSYHVLLPDGRKQIVEYEADEDGFKPTITYEDPEPSFVARHSGHDSGEHNSNQYESSGYDSDSQNRGY